MAAVLRRKPMNGHERGGCGSVLPKAASVALSGNASSMAVQGVSASQSDKSTSGTFSSSLMAKANSFIADGTMRWTYALRTLARKLKGRARNAVAEYASIKAATAGEFFFRDLTELATKLGQ
jgi:hypothetical protein